MRRTSLSAALALCAGIGSMIPAATAAREDTPSRALTDRDGAPAVGVQLAGAGNVLAVGRSTLEETLVRVFGRTTEGWIETAAFPTPGADFWSGTALDTDGGVLAVAAKFADVDAAFGAGEVHLYEHATGGWVSSGRVTAPEPIQGEAFGHAVAIDGAVLAVSALNVQVALMPAGSVHVFERTGGWASVARITLGQGGEGRHFGAALSASGQRIAIGAPHDDLETRAGRVHVYARSSRGWELEQTLAPEEGGFGTEFGRVLALDGNRLAVGSRDGIALFEFDTNWSRVQGFSTAGIPGLGTSLDLAGDRIAAGRVNQLRNQVEQFERKGDGSWSHVGSLCFEGGPPIAVVPPLGGVALAGDTVAARDHVTGEGPVVLFIEGAGPSPGDPPLPSELGGVAIETVSQSADIVAALDLGTAPFDPRQPVRVRVDEVQFDGTFELEADGGGGFTGTRVAPSAVFRLTPRGPQGTHWGAELQMDPEEFDRIDPSGPLTLSVSVGSTHATSRVQLSDRAFSFGTAPQDRVSPGVVIVGVEGRVRKRRRDRLELSAEIGDADLRSPPAVLVRVGDRLRVRIPARAFRRRNGRFVARRRGRAQGSRRIRAVIDPAARTLTLTVRGAEMGRLGDGDIPLRVSIAIGETQHVQELLVRRDGRDLRY